MTKINYLNKMTKINTNINPNSNYAPTVRYNGSGIDKNQDQYLGFGLVNKGRN
jgi:hypothetical protein